MKSFSQYLQERLETKIQELREDKNTHMEHIEELVLNQGVKGTRTAIDFLRDLRDMLNGHTDRKVSTSLKWDGSPSLFAGHDPEDGQFFVAKKSIFNKVPKVYKTPAEVRADTKGDLQKKMLLALKYLPEIGIPKNLILQGDFLYDQSSLGTETVDDEQMITMHPNTIVYMVPSDSDLGQRIKSSKIGVVWHTTYQGKSFQDLSASFANNIKSKLKKSRNVWFDDALMTDLSGSTTLTKSETKELNQLLSSIGKKFQQMNAPVLNEISETPDLLAEMKIFINSKVRSGDGLTGGKQMVQEMIEWFNTRWDNKVDQMKSEKGRENKRQEKDDLMSYFERHSTLAISRVFDLMAEMAQAKQIIINRLNQIGHMRTFVRTSNGFKVVGQEGFVAIDHLGSNAVKLVNRLEFAKNNFSKDILKGWQ